jgi:hypothetical protein
MAENSSHKAGMVVDSGQGPHLLLPRAKTAFDHFDEGFNPCSQLSFGKIPGINTVKLKIKLRHSNFL